MKTVIALIVVAAAGCARPRVQPVAPEHQEADSLRLEVLRLEEAIRARDDTISALRLELQRLKDIDLKPRRPRGASGTGVGDS